jgi:hypothetical protein
MKQEHLFVVFSVALVGTAVLVGMGKLPSASWETALAGILGWLAPSPAVRDISR